MTLTLPIIYFIGVSTSSFCGPWTMSATVPDQIFDFDDYHWEMTIYTADSSKASATPYSINVTMSSPTSPTLILS